MMPAQKPVIALLWRSVLPYHAARLARAVCHPALSDVRVVGMQVTDDAAGYEFLAGEASGVEVVSCLPGARLTELSGRAVYTATLAALRRLGPYCVFSPSTATPEGMAAIHYARSQGARIFIMDDSWELAERRSRVVRAVKRSIHTCIDGAFVPDEWYSGYFARLGIPPDRIVYPVDVIDNDAYRRPEELAPSADPCFLFVGRDLPRKGLAVLLEAYGRYRSHVPDPWQLHVVGPVPRDGSAQAGVVWHGACVGKRLRDRYWSAGVLVVPSTYDHWGLVVNEAMAASLPVISSCGVGAARSLVSEGVTGWTFAPGDVNGLFSLLVAVGSLPTDVRSRMGTAARDRVCRDFSLDRFVLAIDRARRMKRRSPPRWIARLCAGVWRGRLRAY